MKHLDVLYHRLREGKIKQIKKEIGIRYVINKIKVRTPIYTFLRTKKGSDLQIKKAQLIGDITKYKDVYVVKPSTTLTFHVEYYNAGRPVRAIIYQQIQEVKRKVIALLGSNATCKLDINYKVDEPQKLSVVADINGTQVWQAYPEEDGEDLKLK